MLNLINWIPSCIPHTNFLFDLYYAGNNSLIQITKGTNMKHKEILAVEEQHFGPDQQVEERTFSSRMVHLAL